ncbi:MAG TPA: di-heme-cytochrome C peroxidase [Candidatus Angelobacter sp.]|nr:di-heme-cytochrome C peroxidase [Candidatus Angelobacter sp.]
MKATAGTCDATPEVYIGRPLAGIWASPPYLHNGSVPNLYQLLLPGSQRISKFKVGSRTFDPVNVGFDLAVGNFEFDTSLPGNGNKGHEGHEYGTDLSDDQRRQLVEYMKSLGSETTHP